MASGPPRDPPVVSVVIPVRNMAATLSAQLSALERQDFSEPWQVVVADNGSSDGSAEIVRAWEERLPLKLVSAAGSANSFYARNRGAAFADGQLLAFCDADDEVRDDWLRSLVEGLRDHPLVTGPLDHARLNSPDLAASYDDPTGEPWWGFLRAGATANLGVRRSVFDELRGFPEHYQRWGDAAFCWHAQLAGHELAFSPTAIVDRRLKPLGPWGSFRWHVHQGRWLVSLYEEFRPRGMPGSRLRDTAFDLLVLPTWLIEGSLLRAMRAAGWRTGRLIGSIEHRIWFP